MSEKSYRVRQQLPVTARGHQAREIDLPRLRPGDHPEPVLRRALGEGDVEAEPVAAHIPGREEGAVEPPVRLAVLVSFFCA